jgi:hypothetical protein
MPTVRLVTGREPEGEVFVSLEQTPLVLGELRKALPQLRAELQKKWPVLYVDIENQLPARRNSYDPSELVKAACIVLAIRFTWSAVDGAGKKLGEVVVDELSKYARRWIKNFGKPKHRRSAARRR